MARSNSTRLTIDKNRRYTSIPIVQARNINMSNRGGGKPTPTPTPTPPGGVPSSAEPFMGNLKYWWDAFVANTIFGKKKKKTPTPTATPRATPHN